MGTHESGSPGQNGLVTVCGGSIRGCARIREDLEGADGEGGGRGDRDGEDM